MQFYKIDILNLVIDGQVRSDCADITFFNQGTTDVILNSAVSITPGNSLSLTANNAEIDRTLYNYRFSNLPGINKLVVFRKVYI